MAAQITPWKEYEVTSCGTFIDQVFFSKKLRLGKARREILGSYTVRWLKEVKGFTKDISTPQTFFQLLLQLQA